MPDIDHEQKDQQAVIGAAACGDRNDREPLHADLHRHARADQAELTGASASMKKPGRIPARRHSAARRIMAASEIAVGLRRGFGGARARAAEKCHAVGLDETSGGQRRRQRQQRADRRHQNLQSPCRQLRAEQDRLEGQPFRDEAVERRQRRDRHAADQEDEGGLRHAVDEPAEMLHVALAGRVQHRAGAEEQQALEQRMIEDVEQRGGERQRRGERHAVALNASARPRPMKMMPIFSTV